MLLQQQRLKIEAGALATAARVTPTAGAGVSTALPFLVAAKTATWAVPAVGAIVAGVSIAIGVWAKKRINGRQKLQTSEWADEAEGLLKQNLEGYMAARTAANQAQALANFDQVWGELYALCSDPAMAAAGERCVTERDRGGRWDWFALYRDPIERDQPPLSPTVATILSRAKDPAVAGPLALATAGILLWWWNS